MDWFDGHLDLAYLAQTGRDMHADLADIHEPAGPAAVTFPALAAGGVRRAVATIFIEPRQGSTAPSAPTGPWCYGTAQEALEASLKQLAIYREWQDEGRLIILDGAGEKAQGGQWERGGVRHGGRRQEKAGVSDKIEKRWPSSRGRAAELRGREENASRTKAPSAPPLEVLILLEGAAGVRSVDDLERLHEQGVRMLALTWVQGTAWAGGDHSGGGITPGGLRLIDQADRLEMVHDVTHLSEAAFWALLDRAKGPKVASHSNCRALLAGAPYGERHLSDQQIVALARAEGMIGINLYGRFLAVGRPARLADVVRHVQHILDLTGRPDLIGLGSDMDGGFSAADLPLELRRPADLVRLAEALSAAGLSDPQIEQFAHGNWERFLKLSGKAR